MIVDERKVWIYWRVLDSSYAHANKDSIEPTPRSIGSSLGAVNKMLSNSNEQQVLMQDIIGLSPNSELWATKVADYWHSISEDISPSGRELEIGFIYDITDTTRIEAIERLNKNRKEEDILDTEEKLRKYFDDRSDVIDTAFKKAVTSANKLAPGERDKKLNTAYTVKYDSIWRLESERYKFARPIVTVDYMLWRYCMVYSQVANEIDLVGKSPNIRFYLHSEAEIIRAKERKHSTEKLRINTYISVIKSIAKVQNVLYAIGKGDEIKELDETDQFLLLETVSKETPRKFVEVANDKNLVTRGLVEKYIAYSILRRLDGSQVIVDSADPKITIGNNLDEAINFFSNKKNEGTVTELTSRFKGLPK